MKAFIAALALKQAFEKEEAARVPLYAPAPLPVPAPILAVKAEVEGVFVFEF